MASAAAKAVWGESNTKENENANTTMKNETQGVEPVSGKQGDVSKGEPFDAGNIGTSAFSHFWPFGLVHALTFIAQSHPE